MGDGTKVSTYVRYFILLSIMNNNSSSIMSMKTKIKVRIKNVSPYVRYFII